MIICDKLIAVVRQHFSVNHNVLNVMAMLFNEIGIYSVRLVFIKKRTQNLFWMVLDFHGRFHLVLKYVQ